MTDRVRSSGSLLESLRALAIQKAGATGRGSISASPSRSGGGEPVPPHDRAALRRQLQAVVAQADMSPPDALQRLRTPIIREILLWEFGTAFRTHPEFLDMMDAVDQAMGADPTLQARLRALIRDLQRKR